MATARKFLKKCTRKGISKKECKAIAKTISARKSKSESHRLKACKMSDPTAKRMTRWIRNLNERTGRGDGSGAEDRFGYEIDSIVSGVKSRCGAKFAKKLRKNAMKR